MFSRAFTSTARVAQQGTSSTAPTPLRRTKDALLASSTAQHYTLPSGAQFIVRSPPTSLPPSLAIPSTLTSSTTLIPASQPSNEHRLPPSRRSSSATAGERTHLSPTEVESLQSLRRSNPTQWTRSKLAAKFGVSPTVVGMLGWGEGSEGKVAEKSRMQVIQGQREAKEARWGWKKAIAKEERRRRRTLW